jgi:hypothetical protein
VMTPALHFASSHWKLRGSVNGRDYITPVNTVVHVADLDKSLKFLWVQQTHDANDYTDIKELGSISFESAELSILPNELALQAKAVDMFKRAQVILNDNSTNRKQKQDALKARRT